MKFILPSFQSFREIHVQVGGSDLFASGWQAKEFWSKELLFRQLSKQNVFEVWVNIEARWRRVQFSFIALMLIVDFTVRVVATSASLYENYEHCLSNYDLAAKVSCRCTCLLKYWRKEHAYFEKELNTNMQTNKQKNTHTKKPTLFCINMPLISGIRFCDRCQLIKPDRCHHCSVCAM